MKIGEQIHKARKAKRMKQHVLGEKAAISQTYLSQIERCIQVPSVTIVIRIAQVLKTNFTIDYKAYES